MARTPQIQTPAIRFLLLLLAPTPAPALVHPSNPSRSIRAMGKLTHLRKGQHAPSFHLHALVLPNHLMSLVIRLGMRDVWENVRVGPLQRHAGLQG